jgi:hypothetical protein
MLSGVNFNHLHFRYFHHSSDCVACEYVRLLLQVSHCICTVAGTSACSLSLLLRLLLRLHRLFLLHTIVSVSRAFDAAAFANTEFKYIDSLGLDQVNV